jgi:hypothetical protein
MKTKIESQKEKTVGPEDIKCKNDRKEEKTKHIQKQEPKPRNTDTTKARDTKKGDNRKN